MGLFGAAALLPAALADILFVVAGGGNNARGALDLASVPGANVPQIVNDAANAFASLMVDLKREGGRQVETRNVKGRIVQK